MTDEPQPHPSVFDNPGIELELRGRLTELEAWRDRADALLALLAAAAVISLALMLMLRSKVTP